MDRLDTSCLIESKKEYTNLLVRKIKMPIMGIIMDSFKNVKDTCSHTRDEEKLLIFFQDFLEKIPEWETSKVEETTNTIISQSKCDYLEDVLFAVFILHTRIFDAIEPQLESTNKNKIEFPNLSNFLFQTLVNVARENWKYVYLFKESTSSCEYQQNRNKCEEIIESCIRDTITEMLPVRDILQEHIHKYSSESEETDEKNDTELELSQLDRVKRMKKKILKRNQNGGGLDMETTQPYDASPFNDNDNFMNQQNPTTQISAPLLPPNQINQPPVTPIQVPPIVNQQPQAVIPVPDPAFMKEPEIKPVEIPNNQMNGGSGMSENLLDSIDSTHVVGHDNGQIKTVQFNQPLVENLENIDNVLNDLESISYE